MTEGQPEDLNPAAWKDINEAVGEGLSLPPPQATDPDAHSDPLQQKKREGEAVRFQMVTNVTDLEEHRRARLLEQQEAENKRALSRAWALFREDGSLLGEYAPMMGQNTTPDTVDALWWLSLPTAQAMWELGLDPNDDATYSRVRRDIEAMAAVVINRMLQTRTVVPMVIRRKRNRINAQLFTGGQLKRLKAVNPNDFPGRNVSKRNRAKDTPEDGPSVLPI